MTQTRDRGLLIYALVIFIGAAILYRLWLPNQFSGDDLQYTIVIQKAALGDFFYHPAGGQPYIPQADAAALNHSPSAPPLNPRYLLEWPTSTLAARIWSVFGWQGSSIVPIQAVRILVGALGLVFFFLALNRLVSKRWLALLATIGLGVSDAYWIYSTHMDQSINMLTLLCLAFYLFVRQSQTGSTLGKQVLLAAVLAFASFYNFTASVSALAFAIGIALLSPDPKLSSRFIAFVRFGVIYAAIVVAVIAGAIVIFVSPASLTDPAYWRSVTFGGKPEYGIAIVNDTIRAALALAKSQILFPGVPGSLQDFFDTASTGSRVVLLGYYGIVLVIMALPFLYLALRRKQLGNQGKIVAFLAIWLVGHSLFNWFWDPGFNKYWLAPLVCVWSAAAIALDHLQQQTQSRIYRPALWGAIGVVVLSFILNWTTQFLPQSDPTNNPWLTISQSLGTDSQPNDLFVSAGTGTVAHPMDFYLTYFGKRDVLSSGLVTYDAGGNAAEAAKRLEPRITAHRADDGKIYVYGLENLTPEARDQFISLFGSGATVKEAWTFPEMTVYEVVNS